MGVTILKEVKKHQREEALLKRLAQRHLRSLTKFRVPGAAALKKAELSLLLTDDARIQILNRDWRNKDKATDVLSFPQLSVDQLKILGKWANGSNKVAPWELGDIVISLERAEAQAKEKGHSFHRELEVLLVHGILHLLGYDHEISENEARRMQRLEKTLLTR